MNRDELYLLRRQLRQKVSGRGVFSAKSAKNIIKAVQTLRGVIKAREAVLTFWEQCLDISPRAFVLVSSTFASDTINRKGKVGRQRIIDIIQQHNELFSHGVLDNIVTEHNVSARSELKRFSRLESTKVATATAVYQSRIMPTTGVDASRSSGETAAQLVQALVPTFAMQIGSGQTMHYLSTTVDAPAEIQAMWEGSTTSIPIVVPAAACWRTHCPTFEEVWLETLKIPARGGQECRPSSVSDC